MPVSAAPEATMPSQSHDPINLLIVEDETGIRELIKYALGESLVLQGGVILECDTAVEVRQLLDTTRNKVRLVITDLNLPDGNGHIDAIQQYLEAQDGSTGFVLMSGDQAVPSPNLPTKIAYQYLTKPFNMARLLSAIADLANHIRGTASTAQVSTHTNAEVLPQAPSNNLTAIMAALPDDPSQVTHRAESLQTIGQPLVDALKDLLTVKMTQSHEEFTAAWRAYFPSEKRESFLTFIGRTSVAAFVFDCCFHDINNILMRVQHTEGDWEKEKEEVIKKLMPAMEAFQRYAGSLDEKDLLAAQEINIEKLEKQYPSALVAVGLDLLTYRLQAPAGALPSIFETFWSNAGKVCDGRSYNLGLHFREGPHGCIEAIIYDDLKPFTDTQFAGLFDERIDSESAWGMGTGLQRLGGLMQLLWRGENGVIPLESYHLRDGEWWQKNVGSKGVVYKGNIQEIFDELPAGTTKFFIMRFHRSGLNRGE